MLATDVCQVSRLRVWVRTWSNKGQALTSKLKYFYHRNGSPATGPAVWIDVMEWITKSHKTYWKIDIFHHFFQTPYCQHVGFHWPGSATHQTSPHLYTHAYTQRGTVRDGDYGCRCKTTTTRSHTGTHQCQFAVVIGSDFTIISL